jgi:short-subunit dehydrogenase
VPRRVLILGATSDIARAVAQALAARGDALILAAHDRAEVARIAADLRVRHGVEVQERWFDALAFDSHARLMEECFSSGLDGVIACHGYMAAQSVAEADGSEAHRVLDVNLKSYVSLLNPAAARLCARGGGFICALSSVAGDRGRQSNYLYGAAKAGLSAYLQGLRNRLSSSGVAVITVKPGFVDTAMTWGLLKPGSPLVARPQHVARDVLRAIDRHRDVVYTPWFWRWIMLVIRSIPERLFKRLSL